MSRARKPPAPPADQAPAPASKPKPRSKPRASRATTDAGRRLAAISRERDAVADLEAELGGLRSVRERLDLIKLRRRLDEEEADIAFAARLVRERDPEARVRALAERAQASGSYVAAAQLERELARLVEARLAREAAERDAAEAARSVGEQIESLVDALTTWPVHEAVEVWRRLGEVLAPAMGAAPEA